MSVPASEAPAPGRLSGDSGARSAGWRFGLFSLAVDEAHHQNVRIGRVSLRPARPNKKHWVLDVCSMVIGAKSPDSGEMVDPDGYGPHNTMTSWQVAASAPAATLSDWLPDCRTDCL